MEYFKMENGVKVSEQRISVDLLGKEILGIFESMKTNGVSENDLELLKSMYITREFIRDCMAE